MFEPANARYYWQQLDLSKWCNSKTELWICSLAAPVTEISGNKWLKLQSALQHRHPLQGILSFGGAFSNHLAALAAAGHYYNFATIGLVRTEQLDLNNPTLQRCRQLGMQLKALDRDTYRQRQQPEFLQRLKISYPDYLLLPEGGSDQAGAYGLKDLPLQHTPTGTADLLCCATASGGTLAGIIHYNPNVHCLGLSVVKDSSLATRVSSCLPADKSFNNWSLSDAVSAYGKVDPELIEFCCQLKRQYQLSTEPVYTGKALQQLIRLISHGAFKHVKRIAFFHTGGLQGLHGLYYRKLLTEQQYRLLIA